MAHTDRFCAENNDKLIEYLKNKGIIKSSIVTKTMCLVDRKNYVGSSNCLNNEQYTDAPLKISHNRTISSPHMHGMIFEILAEKLSTAKNVLCIRCNTGYVSSCMASMMGPHGTVFHIESIPDLKEKVKKTIKKTNPFLLWTKRMQLLDVENESAGYPQPKVRYDVIYVGAAAAEIPQALIDQLAYGGRLVIPIGPKDLQQLMQIDKNLDGTIVKKTVTSVRYEYLDSPREITNANNNTEIKAENDSNKTSISNLNTVCLNNLISEKVQTQSSTEIPNRSPTKPVKNHFNNNCMKDHLLQTIADKFETKTDEIYAQPSVKDPEENVHKILQDIRTLMTKLELQYDSRSVEKIKDTQEKATSNDRSSESRISHETKMQNTSAIKPVQKKDEVLSITKEKLNNKNDEADTQSSIKESEENIHKTLQESQTLEEKLVLDSKDDPRNIEEIEDTQEKSRPDSSSESRIFHEIMKAQSSVNELSKQVRIIKEENQLLSKQIKELKGKRQGPLLSVARNHEATKNLCFFLIGALAIIMLNSYHTFIKNLLSKD